jgi:hypothetical protein
VLAAGRPVIVTDETIFADCRDDVLPVDPTEPMWMEDAIRRVLTDSELQRDLAGRAAAASHRFRWSLIVSDHREIYCAARTAHRLRDSKVGT